MDNRISENRTQKTNFTQVSNEILNSDKLSWGAKGLWAYMAGKPEGWKFTIRLMASQCKESVSATTSKLNELLELGYIKRETVMTKNGKQCFYSIYEKPNLEIPNLENPNLEKPNLENHILEYSNTNISNKELSKKEKIDSIKERRNFIKPSLEEVQTYCKERHNQVDAESFMDFYESKGWVVGKSPMKNWKAAVRTWERNGYGQKSVSRQTDSSPYKPKEGEDIAYQKMFDKWKQYLGTSLKQTEQEVNACKELLDDLGEEWVEKLIVALRMRSETKFVVRDIKLIQGFKDLADNRSLMVGFYNEHWREWQRTQQEVQTGKKPWELI